MMSSFDWGSVPDWLGAIGSLGAVGAALIIANMERRRAERAEAAGQAVESLLRRQLQITATTGGDACKQFLAALDKGSYVEAQRNDLEYTMAAIHRLCRDLSASTRDPSYLAALAMMAHAADMSSQQTRGADRGRWDVMQRLTVYETVLKGLEPTESKAPARPID